MFLIPLVYVQVTVPEVYRKPASDTVQGRTARVSELAIIHNYKKEGRRVAVVQRPIVFIRAAQEQQSDTFLVVSNGYKTDFASLPTFARLFFNPFDEYAEAAIIHDWLYAIGEPGKKREADMLFLRAMLDDGVSPIIARYFYAAVRLGTLIDGGNYGSEVEWEQAFYSPILEDDLPRACIPSRPETAFMTIKDVLGADAAALHDGRDDNALVAAMMQGFDPMRSNWLESLENPDCQTAIGRGIEARVDRDYGAIIGAGSDESQAYNKFLLTNSIIVGTLTDLHLQSAVNRRYIEAYMRERFGELPPETVWCLNSQARGRILAYALYAETDTPVWPDMTCGEVAEPSE